MRSGHYSIKLNDFKYDEDGETKVLVELPDDEHENEDAVMKKLVKMHDQLLRIIFGILDIGL